LKTSSVTQAVLKNIATFGFIGYLPYAPGTWGSAVGLVFVAALKPSSIAHMALIVAGFMLGTAASTVAEKAIGEKDSGHIIIDEFIGFLVSVFSVPHTYGYLAAAFILFRLFDILKPVPIAKMEKTLSKGLGIMTDDLAAGLYVNVILQIWIKIF